MQNFEDRERPRIHDDDDDDDGFDLKTKGNSAVVQEVVLVINF